MGLLERRAADAAAGELAASVASYALGVPLEAILDEARGVVATAYARQVAMYLCHTGLELSLQRVAMAFGRDRSTVAHACKVMEDKREDPQFELWISGLEDMLHTTPAPSCLRRAQS